MAEININAGHTGHRTGLRRGKKLSTKVDLTPMVDLGFLLITFFIFTTAMGSPKSMKLYLPAGEPTTPEGKSAVLTIIPVSGNKVFYYHGDLNTAIQSNLYGVTTFAISNGIGDIIRQKQTALTNNPRYSKKDLMLIIKPSTNASYQNVVAALDEVLINDLKHYVVVDTELPEKELLAKLHIQ